MESSAVVPKMIPTDINEFFNLALNRSTDEKRMSHLVYFSVENVFCFALYHPNPGSYVEKSVKITKLGRVSLKHVFK